MLLTEKEAKGKWCHAAMIEEGGNNRAIGAAIGDEPGFYPPSACIASACMAWRWGEWEVGTIKGVTPRVHVYDDQKPTKGYCGLAGSVK